MEYPGSPWHGAPEDTYPPGQRDPAPGHPREHRFLPVAGCKLPQGGPGRHGAAHGASVVRARLEGGEVPGAFRGASSRGMTLLNGWSVRAMAQGHVQVIDPEAFAVCCRDGVESGTSRDIEKVRLAEVKPWVKNGRLAFPDASMEMRAEIGR